MENLQNLNLTYPAGLPVHDGGAINVIPGSHLFRDPDNCRGRYAGATTPGGSYYAQHHRQQQPGLPPGGHPTLPAGGAAARGLGSGGRHQPPRPTDKYAPRSTDKTDQQGVGRRAADDVGGIERWMDGKLHPITGEPLRRVEVSLPVGSLVCLNSHAAHAVSGRAPAQLTQTPRAQLTKTPRSAAAAVLDRCRPWVRTAPSPGWRCRSSTSRPASARGWCSRRRGCPPPGH
jgi:hypothetical protein